MTKKHQTFEEFKEKVRNIRLNLPKVVNDESILELSGKYMFDQWGVCYSDLRDYDFSNCSLNVMTKLTFSSSTKWPSEDKLPKGFNPKNILERTTTTNESVKKMHSEGITGEGITVAVIDQPFQGQKHIEFENVELVKCTLDDQEGEMGHFHMECVLSKLCGKNLGIAPKVKVLYYEVESGGKQDDSEAINKIFKDILRRIEGGENIRIVNRSASFNRNNDNPSEFQKENFKLIEVLRSRKCEVISSDNFNYYFIPCKTTFLNLNDGIKQFELSSYIDPEFVKDCISILCSGRTVPEFCTNEGYKYEVADCASWTIPQGVGYYALCLQISPDITFKDFVKLCKCSCDKSSSGLNVLNAEKLIKNVKDNIKERII